jgi:uncharacterized protein with PIN domain
MFGLATTADTIDSLYFLHKPDLTPHKPKCKRCKTRLEQHFDFEENQEDINISWLCPKCGALVQETTEM